MRSPLSQTEMRAFEQLLVEEWRREFVRLLETGILPQELMQPHDHSAAKIAAYTASQKFQPDDPKGREVLQRYFGMRNQKSLGQTLVHWFKNRSVG